MIFKKIAATISAVALSAGMAAYMPVNNGVNIKANAENVDVNYAEALQKSMFFYEVQQAGILPE